MGKVQLSKSNQTKHSIPLTLFRAKQEDQERWVTWAASFGLERNTAERWFRKCMRAVVYRLYCTNSERWPFIVTGGDDNLLNNFPKFACVGTRNLTVEGERLSYWVSRCLVAKDVTTISGGALGVDTAIHKGTMCKRGKTICVLPSGINVASPSSNAELFREIAAHGLLLSPYPMDVTVRRYHYYERNALMVALADAVIVVRATENSGSLITAREALRTDVPVYALSGSPDDLSSAGCLDILTEGAHFYRSAEQVVGEILPPLNPKKTIQEEGVPAESKRTLQLSFSSISPHDQPLPHENDDQVVPKNAIKSMGNNLPPVQTKIFNLLKKGEVTETNLLKEVDGTVQEVLSAISELELLGLIERNQGSGSLRIAK